MFKIIPTLIPKIFLIFFTIFGAQSLAFYEGKNCTKGFNNTKTCQLLSTFKVNILGRYLLDLSSESVKSLVKIYQTNTTSGLTAQNMSQVRNRFDNFRSGFTFFYKSGSRKNAGYLILATADKNNDGEPMLELWDLSNQSLLYKWEISAKEIIDKVGLKTKKNSTRIYHPLITADGNVIARIEDFLIKISPSGELIKFNKEFIFHHSIEIDSQGYLYAPIRNKKGDNMSDGFAILDQNLNIIKTFYLKNIYEKAGLNYKINTPFPSFDPFHLNDVQPLLDSNKTKFVLLSIRNQSSIMALDLKNKKVPWILEGYSNWQHDVDILDDEARVVSVFDNNVYLDENGLPRTKVNYHTTIFNLPSLIDSGSEKMKIFNYTSNHNGEEKLLVKKITFDSLDQRLVPKTVTEGSSEYLSENDSTFIEETNYGRLFELDNKTKKILWTYINRQNKKNIYFMPSWSRRINKLPNGMQDYFLKLSKSL